MRSVGPTGGRPGRVPAGSVAACRGRPGRTRPATALVVLSPSRAARSMPGPTSPSIRYCGSRPSLPLPRRARRPPVAPTRPLSSNLPPASRALTMPESSTPGEPEAGLHRHDGVKIGQVRIELATSHTGGAAAALLVPSRRSSQTDFPFSRCAGDARGERIRGHAVERAKPAVHRHASRPELALEVDLGAAGGKLGRFRPAAGCGTRGSGSRRVELALVRPDGRVAGRARPAGHPRSPGLRGWDRD